MNEHFNWEQVENGSFCKMSLSHYNYNWNPLFFFSFLLTLQKSTENIQIDINLFNHLLFFINHELSIDQSFFT